ncbi:DNA (cytosine-5-)-methyltransferase [Metamycoplasma hyosynoviae]|uniref:DNA cytosine methyltransferase n=1 Tax=Metamycoplasma hyosynoviae TaxID=29559 RepID=UPI002358324C|nr:DNA (cytosine-5-)-methyltransferase [Metamycoplasma hyosynoviae]MDC8921967.1 DNA (cytosine-5-)-methyltransferase [Metamycoplasma hyosynoviae]
MKKYRFIDLFAGIGGFHQALTNLGCKCVCASEIDEDAIKRYKANFPDTPMVGDINKTYYKLPEFDILCGGFPCQPFSKAGKQEGFEDKTRGNLFYRIMDVLDLHPECKFVILENVKNLADKTENWDIIQNQLKQRNFYVTDMPIILSPHQFGIPQIRERVYILGIRKDIRDEAKLPNGSIHMEDLSKLFSTKSICSGDDARKILEPCDDESYFISEYEEHLIRMWYEFKVQTNFDVVGVPVWVEYFGYGLTDRQFKKFVDHKGETIKTMPDWKKKFALKNRAFYLKHKDFIDRWIERYNVMQLPLGYKKFEWNCSGARGIEDTIIQFRQSGIRVKKLNYFPALVAINNTPIIFDRNHQRFRRITPREAANLQSFNRDYVLGNDARIYKQLGNAVNVVIIKKLAKKLMSFERSGKKWKK